MAKCSQLTSLPFKGLRSQMALFSTPRLISGINFHFHFMNQFHLLMLTSIHPSLLHFPHPSPLHSFTLNSKLTFLVNHFRHRSLTIDTSDWLPRLMGPFSVFIVFVGVISCFGAVDKTSSSFSAHGKIGNFIIIIIRNKVHMHAGKGLSYNVLPLIFLIYSRQKDNKV